MIAWIKRMIDAHPTLWEIFKFLLVGGAATVIDFLAMSIVLYVWSPAIYSRNFWNVFFGGAEPAVWATVVSTGVGFLFGLLFNYLLSIFFVFTGKDSQTAKAKTLRGAVMFCVLSAIGLGIHILGMYIGFDLLHMNEWIIKIILTVLVLVFNYVTRKLFIFNKKEKISPANVG